MAGGGVPSGEDVVITQKWSGLVRDEKARIAARLDGLPQPEPTTEPPTEDELREAAEPLDLGALGQVLAALAGKSDPLPPAVSDVAHLNQNPEP